MENINETNQENIVKFVELSLSLILKGFDEMEMQKRLELVKLLGCMINLGIEQYYGRISNLEQRIQILEGKKK